MIRIIQKFRYYCKSATDKDILKNHKVGLNFKQLNNKTKVPLQPVLGDYKEATEVAVPIDAKTIQLLERLSLVDLDSKEALETLKSSIQFANRIISIETANIEPLYTVLESQNLYLREDCAIKENTREEILRNAKLTEEDYFIAPPGNIPLEQEEKNFNFSNEKQS